MIHINNIEFEYKSGKINKIFKLGPLSLQITEGEFISLLGPNGSGKSTLLKLLSGVLLPAAGTMKFKGIDYTEYSTKNLAQNIAFVPQNPVSVYPFTIHEIVMMGRTPYMNFLGYENNIDSEKVDEALYLTDIYDLKDKPITQVSGGEIQRAFIARALAQDTGLILLDEPNSHLDIKHQIELFELLSKLNSERGITIVTVSHDLNLASRYFSRSILMKGGRVLFDGKTKEIINSENIKTVFNVDSTVFEDNKNGNLILSFYKK